MSTHSTTNRLHAVVGERERKAKQAIFAARLLEKLSEAMADAEGDDAAHLAKAREGCSSFRGDIALVYATAADYKTGEADSAELQIEAIQPGRREHQPLYSIDLDLDSPLLGFGNPTYDSPDREGRQFETQEIDSDLLNALWPTRALKTKA
jgi:hypothetical protein